MLIEKLWILDGLSVAYFSEYYDFTCFIFFRPVTEWSVPKQTKLKYNQLFNSNDRNKTGFLTGMIISFACTKASDKYLEYKTKLSYYFSIWKIIKLEAQFLPCGLIHMCFYVI